MNFSLFAASAPGLEPYTAQELRQLNLARVSAVPGGVEFRGSQRDIYRANLHLRTASRILVRLGEFYAAAFAELRKTASRLPWEQYLAPGQPIALKVTCHKSKLYHSDAVAERIVGAIEDRLGRRVRHLKGNDESETAPAAQLILARLDHDHCTISVDASGELLHRRGYRLATAKAPLRETLAAGMLLASGWDTRAPLLDPFCGSGTIAIEAALLAYGLPPGRARRFAFMDWPDYAAALWQALLADPEQPSTHAVRPIIQASDRDAGAIAAARANAERAGVADRIEFTCRAVSAIEPPAFPGWVVTNPPYGVRVSQKHDLRNLYAQLGHVLRAKCPGWRIALLTNSVQLQKNIGIDFDGGAALVNGGLRVRLFSGKVLRAEP
ncbi:MAG TPA: THUMP domain-containing protein [Anaerolineae bacterium]|nr:THUMP domain-containing protein [Anaerolineae bacterium]